VGYKEAIEESETSFDEALVRLGDYRYRSGYEEMKSLLESQPGVSAVFAASDEMAVGAIHAVQDLGKRVPEDVSVIGFENIPLSSQVRPLLSTVSVPMYDIGAVAMRLLTKYMNDEQVESGQVYLQYSMELRNSTKLKEWEDER
jgi:LacI family transcriptional regulator